MKLLPPPNTLIDPGVALSAIKLQEIFKTLEELESFNHLKSTERLERWSEASSRESFSTKKPLSLDFSNHSSIFAGSAYLREKEAVGKVLQQLIAASQHETDGSRHYEEADQLWAQAQAAWESRTAAQWKVEASTKILTEARERLKRAKEIFDNTKLDETALGRIASLIGRAAEISAAIPAPHAQGVSGIFGTVSTIAGAVNHLWTHADVDAAEFVQTLATRAADSAKEAVKKANEAAPGIDQLAKNTEQQARLREESACKADAVRLQPPVTSFNKTDWNDWATRIVQAGRGDASTIPFLADHGMSDPLWTADIVKSVGQTKALGDLQADKAEKQRRIEPFEKDFKEAATMLQQANETTTAAANKVTIAQDRLAAATQFHLHWRTELEESNAALNDLEKPANARKVGNDQAIKIQKEKFSTAWKNFQQASNVPVSLASQRIVKQNFQKNSSASISTVKTKSNRSQSSLGSLVSWKTGTSRASAAQTIPESIASTASRSELKGLKRTMKALTESAQRWAYLVRKADAERVAAGGMQYPDEETLFDAWQKTDAMAQAAWKKRCALQEEMARAAALHQQ